jgi:hypothetical protein
LYGGIGDGGSGVGNDDGVGNDSGVSEYVLIVMTAFYGWRWR